MKRNQFIVLCLILLSACNPISKNVAIQSTTISPLPIKTENIVQSEEKATLLPSQNSTIQTEIPSKGIFNPVAIDNNHELAITPDGKELWVYMADVNSLIMVNIESNEYKITGELKLPGNRSVPILHIIFSPDGSKAFITNSLQCDYEKSCADPSEFQQVIVIDTDLKSVSSTILVKHQYAPTTSLAISPDSRFLFLTVRSFDGQQEGIYKLDLTTQQMVNFISLPGVSYIVLSADGKYLYCAQGFDHQGHLPNLFSIIDISNSKIISSIPVGNRPLHVSITPDGTKAYITNQLSNDVTVVDLVTMKVKTTIAVGPNPNEIAILANGKKAYVGNTGGVTGAKKFGFGSTVSVIDTLNDVFVKDIEVGLEPDSVVLTTDGESGFISDGNANALQPAEVHIIDTIDDTYQNPIILRKAAYYVPTGIDVTPDDQRIFVISEVGKNLLTIDVKTHNRLATQILFPRAVKVSRDGQSVFVYSPRDDTKNGEGMFYMLNVETLQIQKSINLGVITTSDLGDQIVYRIVLNSKEDIAYLAGGDGDEVIVVDLVLNRIVDRIRVGDVNNRTIVPARGITITPDDKKVYVTSCLTQSVSVIDTASRKVTSVIPVANCPTEIEISPDGKKVSVLHTQTTDIITVIDTQTDQILRVAHFPAMLNAAFDFYISPDQKYVYIACFDPNWIMVYDLEEKDPGKVIKAVIKTGLDPFNLAVDGQKQFLYITNLTSDSISVVDLQKNSIVDTIPLQ